jgi:uncharacterized short protein YbdD (DUF466 family)
MTAAILKMIGMVRFARLWHGLARILGEEDYSRYCEHLRRKHPGKRLPTPEEFYLAGLRGKYSRISRCC